MWSLGPIDFPDLPGWEVDDHEAALAAFSIHALKPADDTYSVGKLGLEPEWFDDLIATAKSAASGAKDFFEKNFNVYHLKNSGNLRGHVTGFYEPIVAARRNRTGSFQTPILARPHDLIAINEQNRPDKLDPSFRFGRKTSDGLIVEYFDRAAIQAGAMGQNEHPIAFVENPVDAFFIHIQGAARLVLADGSQVRVTYDGKSGQPFTAIGKLLIERGEIPKSEISMQSIRAWLANHPDLAAGLMAENRSYIFFKEAEVLYEILGPIAAAKIPLSPNRSLAVDRLIHTYSTPIFVSADRVNGQSFNRLMIAQETGTAIVGPARGDIFFGSGAEAGHLAGAVNSPCEFYLLIPKDAPFDPSKVVLP